MVGAADRWRAAPSRLPCRHQRALRALGNVSRIIGIGGALHIRVERRPRQRALRLDRSEVPVGNANGEVARCSAAPPLARTRSG